MPPPAQLLEHLHIRLSEDERRPEAGFVVVADEHRIGHGGRVANEDGCSLSSLSAGITGGEQQGQTQRPRAHGTGIRATV